MATNRGIAYVGPGKVEVRSIDFPKLIGPGGRRMRSRRDPEDRNHQYLRQ